MKDYFLEIWGTTVGGGEMVPIEIKHFFSAIECWAYVAKNHIVRYLVYEAQCKIDESGPAD